MDGPISSNVISLFARPQALAKKNKIQNDSPSTQTAFSTPPFHSPYHALRHRSSSSIPEPPPRAVHSQRISQPPSRIPMHQFSLLDRRTSRLPHLQDRRLRPRNPRVRTRRRSEPRASAMAVSRVSAHGARVWYAGLDSQAVYFR